MNQGSSLGDTNYAATQDLGTEQDVIFPDHPPQAEQSKATQPTLEPYQSRLSSPEAQTHGWAPSSPWYQAYGLSESPFYQANPQASPAGQTHSTSRFPVCFPTSNYQQVIGPGIRYPGCYGSRRGFEEPAWIDFNSQNIFPSYIIGEHYPIHNKMALNTSTDAPDENRETCLEGSSIEQEKRLSESRSAESYEEDVNSIFNMDIPGFPMPPPLIPTPSLAISPPPTVPCPPLPTGHIVGGAKLAPMYDKKGKAPCRNTQPTVKRLREGEDGFSGLEVNHQLNQTYPCEYYIPLSLRIFMLIECSCSWAAVSPTHCRAWLIY